MKLTMSGINSWLKFLAASLCVCLLVGGIVFFSIYAGKILNYIPEVKAEERILSNAVLLKVNSLVNLNKNIVGIEIVSFNMQKNMAHVLHSYLEDEQLNKLYSNYRHVFDDYPVFTADIKNNAMMTRLLNHEFTCVPFPDSPTSRFIPDSNKYVTVICSVAVPPEYGTFLGIITVMLILPPDEIELAYLRRELSRLSAEIRYL